VAATPQVINKIQPAKTVIVNNDTLSKNYEKRIASLESDLAGLKSKMAADSIPKISDTLTLFRAIKETDTIYKEYTEAIKQLYQVFIIVDSQNIETRRQLELLQKDYSELNTKSVSEKNCPSMAEFNQLKNELALLWDSLKI